MEMNRVDASNPPQSVLLKPKPKPEPNAPKFMQALAEAVETATSKTLKAEPANLARQVKPRCHLDLISLNLVQTSYVPEAAALERVGRSRILPLTTAG
ncbi:hypothetical protein [Pseudomonas sp. Pseu.R1]|uniref:hypothetical protein n=1 Tax=Pseudomonas sp. Pseu.R1 TaxID=3379818 RepID=UPI003B925051